MVSAPLPPPVAALYPFRTRSLLTPAGARMSYLDEGPRGPEAALMVHGNPTWSFYYRGLVRELSPRVRCVAADHVGMGLSEKPARYDYSLARRIGDLEALVDSLGLGRIHLVVHDWGGPIGLGLAVRRPAAIASIIIQNTAAFHSDRIPARIAACRAPVIGEVLVRGLNGFAGPAACMAMSTRPLTAQERAGYLFPYRSWADRVAVARFVKDIPLEASHPSRAALDEVERGLGRLAPVPKLILWGGRDFCFDDTFLNRWRGIYPDARVERLPDAGHYVLEDGGPAAVAAAASFITQNLQT
jgi:pimeloyl-ACP methyl ester carboxylesterase